MRPHEFWNADLTPAETMLWLNEASKDRVIVAWNIAALNRLGKSKQFPKTPDELFAQKVERSASTPEQMFAVLATFVKNQKKDR